MSLSYDECFLAAQCEIGDDCEDDVAGCIFVAVTFLSAGCAFVHVTCLSANCAFVADTFLSANCAFVPVTCLSVSFTGDDAADDDAVDLVGDGVPT